MEVLETQRRPPSRGEGAWLDAARSGTGVGGGRTQQGWTRKPQGEPSEQRCQKPGEVWLEDPRPAHRQAAA